VDSGTYGMMYSRMYCSLTVISKNWSSSKPSPILYPVSSKTYHLFNTMLSSCITQTYLTNSTFVFWFILVDLSLGEPPPTPRRPSFDKQALESHYFSLGPCIYIAFTYLIQRLIQDNGPTHRHSHLILHKLGKRLVMHGR
jgi:hypothetical protein